MSLDRNALEALVKTVKDNQKANPNPNKYKDGVPPYGIYENEAMIRTIINPFLTCLGYDPNNPMEVRQEYTADIGVKEGEKVDYAVMKNSQPQILIELKKMGTDLESTPRSQLSRYFHVVSTVKFAILTDGQYFHFFTELTHINTMDEKPYLKMDLLNLKEDEIGKLERFSKAKFNPSELSNCAREWYEANIIRTNLDSLLDNPSDDFIKLLTDGLDVKRITSGKLETLKPIVNQVIWQKKLDAGAEQVEIFKRELMKKEKEAQLALDIEKAKEVELKSQNPSDEENLFIEFVRCVLNEKYHDLDEHRIGFLPSSTSIKTPFWVTVDGKKKGGKLCSLHTKPKTGEKIIAFPDGSEYVVESIHELSQHREKLFAEAEKCLK